MLQPRTTTLVASQDKLRPILARPTVEFLVLLSLSILLFRTFAAEAYIVPTGSMAPTLLGDHEEIACPQCAMRFALGYDGNGRTAEPLCPNCGTVVRDHAAAVECSGDRVLVQKCLYDLRRPERWEVAVFHNPSEPTQAYVKRVVGLPGESVQIVQGDVWINGQIARKTLREQRAMRILVHDNNFVPRGNDLGPRWLPCCDRGGEQLPSGWHAVGTRFIHDPIPATVAGRSRAPLDWIEYHHRRADRANRSAPVSDFLAYNGSELPGENLVNDLMLEANLVCGHDVRDLTVRINLGGDRFFLSLPIGGPGAINVKLPGRTLAPLKVRQDGLAALASAPSRTVHLEVSVVDRSLQAAVDGVLLFDPIDLEDPRTIPHSGDSPVALGVRSGSVVVGDLRVYRDVHYTSTLANTLRRPFAVNSPYLLGTDEFFVLGDNSPVSNDSRFWAASPVVPRELFLGKPFLVHLPGQVVPLKVFGRSVYWVPDPREIRYIH
jgi:signal peptidase I